MKIDQYETLSVEREGINRYSVVESAGESQCHHHTNGDGTAVLL